MHTNSVLPGGVICLFLLGALSTPVTGNAQSRAPAQQLVRDIYRELIELNTVTATGDTARAAQAMADRLLAAPFPASDVRVFRPAEHKGNLVARLRGTGARKPILLLAHLDVVEAKREDWSLEPFKLLEQDGYFYGRGTGDDKFMAAAFIANLIRYRQESFTPDRDIIVVLETDEEILDRNKVGMQWLLEHHRDLVDAEFAFNEGAGVGLKDGKPLRVGVQTSEKVPANFLLEANNPGGHSSLPTRDNAIYRLAAGLVRLGKFEFPVQLNETTRAWLERAAPLEEAQVAADMRAVAAGQADAGAIERLSSKPVYNAQLRTTCVATLLQGGHAENALPQSARATVNCRVLPGESIDDVHKTLVAVLDDAQISVAPTWVHVSSAPSPLNAEIMQAVEQLSARFWPGAPVIPAMSSGATDGSFLRNAGIPTYGHSGLAMNIDDIRAHGKDERIPVKSFYEGAEYLYLLVKTLASAK
jgi:acetylornithine deacetylase/succinyl-diaminopimelate desuccinylase-like protein